MRPLIVMLLSACTFLSGCGSGLRSLNPAPIVGPYEVEAVVDGNRIEYEIPDGSPEASAIQRWLAAHRSGWSASIDTYAPGSLVIRSGNFNLMLNGETCIFTENRTFGGKQLVKRLDAPSREQLQAACRIPTASHDPPDH